MQSTDNDRDSRMGDPTRYNKGVIQGPLRDNSSRFDGLDSLSNRSTNTHINTNNRNPNMSNKRQKQNGNQSGFGSDGDDVSYRTMTSAASGFSFSANLREREAETAAQRGSITHQPNPNRDNNDYRDIVIANEVTQLVYPAGVVGKAMILTKNKKNENVSVKNSSNNDINKAILEDFREGKNGNSLDNRKRQRSDETNWERLDAERWASHDNNTPRKKKSQYEKGFGDNDNNNNKSNKNNNNNKNNNSGNMNAATMKINQQKANTHTQRMKASGLNEISDNSKNGRQKYVRGSEPVQNLGSRSVVVQTKFNDRPVSKRVLDNNIEKGPARRFGDNNNNNNNNNNSSSSGSSNNNSNNNHNNKNSSVININGKESNKSNTSKRAKLKSRDATDAQIMKSSSNNNNSKGGRVARSQFTVRLQ